MSILPATAPRPRAERRARSTRAALRLTGVELRLLTREPMVVVGLLGFPLALVLVLAGVFGSAPDPDFAGVAPDDHYIAGYMAIVLAALGLITLPVHIAGSRELGVHRRFRAAGLGAPALVASQLLVGTVLALAAAAIVLAAGAGVYGIGMPEDILGVAGWFLVGLACFLAIGVALGSLLRGARAANAIGNLLFVPILLLGGGGPPREVMTGVMRSISDVLPLSHVVGGIRQSWLGTTDDPHRLWWPLAVAAVGALVAVYATHRREAAAR